MRGLRFHKGVVYVSYFKFNKSYDCYGLSVDRAELDAEGMLHFSSFYDSKKCYKSYAAGGQIEVIGKHVFISVGGYDSSFQADSNDWDNDIGSVVRLNIDGGGYEIFAKGLRNPMGLTSHEGKIFISDNGPMGGDIFSLVKRGDHFGWPSHSYGYDYSRRDFYKRPLAPDFSDPTYYFMPDIGASQVEYYSGDRFVRFKEKFLLASLGRGSLFVIDYDFTTNRVRSIEEIHLGYRIRSIFSDDEGFIWLLSDDGIIVKLGRDAADMPDPEETK